MRIASHRAALIGGGELPGGDHHHHLHQQRRERHEAQSVAGENGGRHAQDGEGKREIMTAQRIKHVDAAGKNLPCVVTLGHGFGGH